HDPLGLHPEYDNFASLSPRLAGWLIKGCIVAFAGLVVWSCRTTIRSRQGWRLAAEFSLIVLGMLLFSERTWKHHCVTLLLPFTVLAGYLDRCRQATWLRGYLIGTLAVVALLMASTSTTLLEGSPAMAKLAQAYGAYT